MVEERIIHGLSCPQCGGAVPLRGESIFLDCPYCDSALYVEADTLYRRTVLAPALRSWHEARACVEEWAGREHGRRGVTAMQEVMDGLLRPEMRYFPVWVLRTKHGGVHVEPAAVTAAMEMWKLDIEAGRIMATPLRDEALPMPEVPRQAALAWAARRGVDPATIAEIGLAYVPVYVLHCSHEGELFTVVVEASTGRVLADTPPPTLGLSWRTISYLSCVAFLVAGSISGVLGGIYAICAFFFLGLLGSLERSAHQSCGLPRAMGSFSGLAPACVCLSQYAVNAGVWLATFLGLVMIFSGRWKLFRVWGRIHGKT
jgi:hypothetical protein